MAVDLVLWVPVAVALFWLWYPDWDNDRRKRRREEVERQMKRIELVVKGGIDIEDRAAVQEMIDDYLRRHR